MARALLRPPHAKGVSCTRTLLAALEDTELRPEVLHVVGIGSVELSFDFDTLAKGLPPGARVVLIGPGAAAAGGLSQEALLGPEEQSGLSIAIFPYTYQRYLVRCHRAEAPQFVALFHPGLDLHYFSWYPCLQQWTASRVPVLVTAYSVPGGHGEKPCIVKTLLETLVGTGGGAGMWVIEEENPHSADDGAFNAGYFVILGSQGALPILADEMYFPLFQALSKVGHPFAPRVGYLDIGDAAQVSPGNLKLLAAIAEGAIRGARAGEDSCDEATAQDFAIAVLDQTLGPGTGAAWRRAGVKRLRCENCGDGFDEATWHESICPAVGLTILGVGDRVRLANLQKAELNNREGVLQRFNREKARWVVRLGERDALFKPLNLEHVPADATAAGASGAGT